MTVRRVKFADTLLPLSQVYDGADDGVSVPIIFSFFVIEDGTRIILADAGCTDMPGFVLENFIPPDMALKEQGIAPEKVTDIIVTHAHHDHIDGVKLFPSARVYLQAEEYPSAAEYLGGREVTLFDDDCPVTENVRAVRIGGHTSGSSVVEVTVPEGTVVLCGDECYTRYNFDTMKPTGSSADRERSLRFLQKYSDNAYICLLTHDERGDEVYFNGN